MQQAGPLPAVDYYLVALLLQISNSVWLVGVARGTARGVMVMDMHGLPGGPAN